MFAAVISGLMSASVLIPPMFETSKQQEIRMADVVTLEVDYVIRGGGGGGSGSVSLRALPQSSNQLLLAGKDRTCKRCLARLDLNAPSFLGRIKYEYQNRDLFFWPHSSKCVSGPQLFSWSENMHLTMD